MYYHLVVIKIRGMCGNYNDDKSDDYMLKSGTIATRLRDVADDHKVGQCADDVPDEKVCTAAEDAKW